MTKMLTRKEAEMVPNEYRKPNMTNMPSELGMRIFEQILRAPAPDHKRLAKEAERLEKKMVKARKAHE